MGTNGRLNRRVFLKLGDLAAVALPTINTAGDIGSAARPLFAYALAPVSDLRWVYLFCATALISCLLATVGRRGVPNQRVSKHPRLD